MEVSGDVDISTVGPLYFAQRSIQNIFNITLVFDVLFWTSADDEAEQGLWQNGQFGKIRFDPCPALKDPCPALQPITIQYPRITGLPPTATLLILVRFGSKRERKCFDKESDTRESNI